MSIAGQFYMYVTLDVVGATKLLVEVFHVDHVVATSETRQWVVMYI